MGIDIISLTSKGDALSHSASPHNSNDWKVVYGWKVIYFLKKVGRQSTFDKISTYIFGGNEHMARQVITFLKVKEIVTGE